MRRVVGIKKTTREEVVANINSKEIMIQEIYNTILRLDLLHKHAFHISFKNKMSITIEEDKQIDQDHTNIEGEPTDVEPDYTISYTMTYLKYYVKKLDLLNKRRLQNWFDVFVQITKKIQFPSMYALLDREEISRKKSEMLQSELKNMVDRDKF